ncbi:hypothetical protein HYALB_00002072 [Hymenoscyphus albidus]|uniref:Cytochrome P450 n=1 Tax=Hymenoscyphus albidus TaxID=595503 RepID=A0A9N9PQM5_9HELO|nr:hypothetical protein HYALB_00002072 [Hymenoscyphus albidus]
MPLLDMFSSTMMENRQTLLTVILAFVAILSLKFMTLIIITRKRLNKIPLMGKELGGYYKRRIAFLGDPMSFYWDGHYTHKNEAFRVTHYEGERVVVPRSALEELWNISETILNKNKAYNQYTGLTFGNPFLTHCIRSDPTKNLTKSLLVFRAKFSFAYKSSKARINQHLVSEAEQTVDETLGPCEEWTPYPLYRTALRIVAIVSGSAFVGPEMCRNEQFIHDSVHFTESVMAALHTLQRWPGWMRLITRFFKAERTRLKKSWDHLEASKALMRPNAPQTDDDLAGSMVQLGVTVTHNTSVTVALTVYQLAIRPELVEELHEEIRGVVATFDRRRALPSCTQRHEGISKSGSNHPFHRYVEKDITLKDGTFIPAGITIESIFAPPLSDPAEFTNPNEFDAHRFLKLRHGEVPDPQNYSNKEQ